jgi:hypothetical protein
MSGLASRRLASRRLRRKTLAHRLEQAKYYASSAVPRRLMGWTQHEIDAITAPDRPHDKELSRKLDRSVRAIQIKRHWTIRGMR